MITAALAWFDEDPEDLDRFVRSLDGFVDRLVAVDGGYERYPGAEVRSKLDEEDALRDACADIALPLDIVIPDRLWRGQIEKRTFLIKQAAAGSDWVFTLDADHILHGVTEAFRQEMSSARVMRRHRVELDFFTTVNPFRAMHETSSTEWHSELAGKTVKMGLLLKALPQMRYERFHWWVSAVDSKQKMWVYGGDESLPKGSVHELRAPVFVEHRCHFRRDRNIVANRVFCEDRVKLVSRTGQEDAVA